MTKIELKTYEDLKSNIDQFNSFLNRNKDKILFIYITTSTYLPSDKYKQPSLLNHIILTTPFSELEFVINKPDEEKSIITNTIILEVEYDKKDLPEWKKAIDIKFFLKERYQINIYKELESKIYYEKTEHTEYKMVGKKQTIKRVKAGETRELRVETKINDAEIEQGIAIITQ
jgi:hypothetical protein